MWILFSLLSALGQTANLTLGKKLMSRYSSWFVTWVMMLMMFVILMIGGVFLYNGLPWENWSFVFAFVVSTIFYVLGFFIIIESTKRCDLSIVAPIVALTPIFLIVIEFFWRGSVPNMYGFGGIGLVVLGGYVLNLSKAKGGQWLEPIFSIFRQGSGLFAFAGAVFFAFSAAGAKVSLGYTDIASFAIGLYVAAFVFMSLLYGVALIVGWTKLPGKIPKRDWAWLVASGLSLTINGIANQIAFGLASYASYVIAVKRLSALFGVGLGYLVFKEKGIGERALGAFIMVAGVIVLAVWG